jgi:hypothetical protein
MTDYTASRLGQINAAGGSYSNDTALFLKVFSGEVLTAFDRIQVMKDRIRTRSISSGKSAQFPVTGTATASYHTPGKQLLGSNQIKANELVISIDGLLVSDVFISNWEEAVNHYDVRGNYSHQLGQALANTFDRNALQVGYLAARASATITGGNGGSALTNAAYGTDAEVLAAGVFAAAQKLDEKDIPADGRYVVLRPAQYYLLAQSTKVLNKDWGGAGVYADGKVLRVAGVEVVKSNNLPQSNISANTGENNTYSGDFSNSRALVLYPEAIGCVKLMDLAVEKEYQIQRQGTLMVAKFALGMGILRPECAVELKTA